MSNIQEKRILNLNTCIGTYNLNYDFAPGGDPLNTIPCRITVEYDGVIQDSGFCGDSSFNSSLTQQGYPPVVSNLGKGVLKINKLTSLPTTALVTVDSPLPGSSWKFSLNCPPGCYSPPTPTPTPNPTLEPTPNPTLEPTPNPTLEPTPNPTLEPEPTSTPEPTIEPTPEPCITCEENPACCEDFLVETPNQQSLDFSFIIKKPKSEILPKEEEQNETSLNCCPVPPVGGGDVHFGWSGFIIDQSVDSYLDMDFFQQHIHVDDNYIIKPEINPRLENTVFDHFAIEWVEKHANGSLHAIITKRTQVCKWPATTICDQIIKIGKPVGATIVSKPSALYGPPCGPCKVANVWYRYFLNLKPNLFKDFIGYGGIYWELLKWITDNSEDVGSNGFTGPMGKRASFWESEGFRTNRLDTVGLNDSLTKDGVSLLTNKSPYYVYDKLKKLSDKIKIWRDQGQQDLSAEAAKRKAILDGLTYAGETDPENPDPENPDPENPQPAMGTNPCCYLNDIEFELGGCSWTCTQDLDCPEGSCCVLGECVPCGGNQCLELDSECDPGNCCVGGQCIPCGSNCSGDTYPCLGGPTWNAYCQLNILPCLAWYCVDGVNCEALPLIPGLDYFFTAAECEFYCPQEWLPAGGLAAPENR
jgi:hypothetical protein